MEHSKKFEQIKEWYEKGYWSQRKVYDAVGRLITAEEYEEIVGEPYVPIN